MITSILLFGALALILLYYLNKKYNEVDNLPPGPTPLPLIGNIHQLTKHPQPHKTMVEWSKVYGDIYTFMMGPTRAIVVSDMKLIKELYSTQEFSGKWQVHVFNDPYDNAVRPHGIINAEGEDWEQLRRFTIRQLRDFGFGKNAMEDYIRDELQDFLDWLKEKGGKPVFDIESKLTLVIVSALWAIVGGTRVKHDDPEFKKLAVDSIESLEKASEKGSIGFLLPWLRHIIPEWSGYNEFRRVMKNAREFFEKYIAEHKRTYSEDYARDFIDVFLKQMYSTTDPKSPFYKEEGDKMLVGTVIDLFLAGSGTTSSTVTWAILYLSKFPEVQKKFQEEIKSVTLNSRLCSISDRVNMPYTEAVLAEIMRFSSLVPSGGPHRVLKEMTVRGHTIPKDSIIFPNQYGIHFSREIWGDPENFRPERHIGSDGKYCKNENLIPFSIGRRQCPGQSLAMDSMFMYLTNVYQSYSTEVVEKDLDVTDALPGPVLRPRKFNTIFKERK